VPAQNENDNPPAGNSVTEPRPIVNHI
jgi:hypothetical protein